MKLQARSVAMLSKTCSAARGAVQTASCGVALVSAIITGLLRCGAPARQRHAHGKASAVKRGSKLPASDEASTSTSSTVSGPWDNGSSTSTDDQVRTCRLCWV